MTDPSPPTSAQSLVVATAGHVDHGKSSLVKALTGHDTDTLQEEIARGLTINLGYAYTRCEAPGSDPVWLGFVDVPGHRDFINNMLAGVSAVEGALLVVAVDDGIMPQTREHLAILDLLGIHRGVVALTKIDRGSDARRDEVTGDIRALLAPTALAAAPIVPVSSLNGRGVDRVRAALLALRSDPAHADAGQQQRCRFLVDRRFTVKGVGTVVTGTAVAGALGVGDSLRHSASGEVCRIRGIRLHEQTLETISAGQRAALNVTLPPASIGRGDWLGDAARQQGVSRFDGSLRLLAADTALKSGVQYHLYIGASHRLAHLRVLAADNAALIRVTCDAPLFVHHGDHFIVRDPADRHTIAGGQVLDCLAPARRPGSDERIRFLKAQTRPALSCLQALLAIPPGVVDMDAFARNRNLTEAAVTALLDELVEDLAQTDNSFVRLTDPDGLLYLVAGASLARWRQGLVDWLESYHREHPGEQGVADAQLWQASVIEGSRQVCRAAIGHWLQQQVLQRTGSLLHLPAHSPRLSEADRQFMERIQPLLRKAGRVPPRTCELVEQTGIQLGRLEKLLKELTRSGHLVQVADNRYFLPETLLELADFCVELAEQVGRDQSFTVIQFRDASGIGRNLCIEILEYFDSVGFTRRRDNVRLIRATPARVFRYHPEYHPAH